MTPKVKRKWGHEEEVSSEFSLPRFNWKLIGISIVLLIAAGLALYAFSTTVEIYPPTEVRGHSESSPPSHVLSEPMSDPVQKHMLEHADGRGRPGVIINYNCQEFDCTPELLDNLEAIVNQYPDFVYLAPYPGMSARIVVTRYGEQEILDAFDEERITAFIERR